MFTYVLYNSAGFMCSLLSAILIPPFLFNYSTQFISAVILDPASFVIGMFFFLIGFLASSALFRNSIELLYAYSKKGNISLGEIFVSSLYLLNFIVLFLLNFSVFLLFFLMTVIYGMISINLKRHLSYERSREEL
ncbi:hypothetical protein [Bacillus suaedaesalsae]|uniref:Uncharacterized protein n=1 Tax=Bacillus suaedaesalsae TaxID=2810349 RepID=A0ABS2DN21_9BACI|nr:hypothetical protein [Bacillus suaedaesalsae]MBM6619897.1 hypothetical protein [Bacillus suaedaesalsae]